MKSVLLGLAFALVFTACSPGTSTSPPVEANASDYRKAMANIIEPANTATDNWSAVADRISKMDTSKVSRDQAIGLARESLDVATKLHTVMANATTAIRDVLPPTECTNFHLKVLESLQLTERASLGAKGYFENLLRPDGFADNSVLDFSNELLERADRAKVEAELAARRDGCPIAK